MFSEPLIERLPPLLQNTVDRDQLSVTYNGEDEYLLPKAPATEVHEVSGYVDGEAVVFEQGVNYRLVSDEDDNPERIDWDTNGASPDVGTKFTVDQTFDTVISRYAKAHDEEMGEITRQVEEAITAHQIDNATGDNLDRLGALYGQLGLRRGRDDDEYRIYLKSIVDAFNGRGSLGGLKFAIASSMGTTKDNVEIDEDFENLKYSIQISNVDATFMSSGINDLAELADPSVVELDEAIILLEETQIHIIGDEAYVSEETVGLGGETLTLDGNSQLG